VSVAGGELVEGIDITAEPFLGTSTATIRAVEAFLRAAAGLP
jgi:hypothetical protein